MPDKPTSVLNIAHRGARAYAPENTLPAFAKAADFGCDMFELDVRLSNDEHVIVHHDENLLRCTDVLSRFPNRASYELTGFTLAELKQLDAGSWFCTQLDLSSAQRQPFLQSLSLAEMVEFITESDRYQYQSGDVKIPALIESLQLAKDLGLKVNIELKSGSAKDNLLVQKTVNIVQDLAMEKEVLISSFHLDLIKQVRQYNQQIATAALTDKPLKAPLTTLRKLKANTCNMGRFGDFTQHNFNNVAGKRYLAHLKKLRNAGYDINIWTCNDADEMAALINGGVTGLITDYPNRASEAINAHSNSVQSYPS